MRDVTRRYTPVKARHKTERVTVASPKDRDVLDDFFGVDNDLAGPAWSLVDLTDIEAPQIGHKKLGPPEALRCLADATMNL